MQATEDRFREDECIRRNLASPRSLKLLGLSHDQHAKQTEKRARCKRNKCRIERLRCLEHKSHCQGHDNATQLPKRIGKTGSGSVECSTRGFGEHAGYEGTLYESRDPQKLRDSEE